MSYAAFQATIMQTTGRPAPFASVSVKIPNGELATLYSARDGTEIGNPITANSIGFVRFYAAAGRYDVVATFNGNEAIWKDVVMFADICGLGCGDVINALEDIDASADNSSMGIFSAFPNDSSAGLTWQDYNCVFAANSTSVDPNWTLPATVDWADCNTTESPFFINAILDVRNGGAVNYAVAFTFTFTNVPTNETSCKAFVCGTRGGGDSDFGLVTLPGGANTYLVNYGAGPANSNKNRMQYFVINNDYGTLTGTFKDLTGA